MVEELKAIMGLECHVQLNTKTKLFCSCTTASSEPNSATCEVCLGMPGSKPVLNEKALEFAARISIALNCELNQNFFFSRKTYFYPDMAKNYQITQYEEPIARNGFITLPGGKKIRIQRIQIEEDPAALVHEGGIQGSDYVLVDYNRSGIPLVEIVTAPDLDSPKEARQFLDKLLNVLEYLGVFELGKNALKVDSNISIQGSERVEVKNITGFQAVEKALSFEILRQRNDLKFGKKIVRETRGFDDATGTTQRQRLKESEDDYGYIADPDLPVIELSPTQLKKFKESVPELPDQKSTRFQKQFKLKEYDAQVLCANFALSNLFEEIVREKINPELAAAFLSRELLSILNHDSLELRDLNLQPKPIASLLKMLQAQKITEKSAKEAMISHVNQKIDPVKFIQEKGFIKSMNERELLSIIDQVIAENPSAVQDFLGGKEKSFHFLVGLVSRKSAGKAEPRLIQELLQKKIKK